MEQRQQRDGPRALDARELLEEVARETTVRQRRAAGDADDNQVDDPRRLLAKRRAPELRERSLERVLATLRPTNEYV